MTTPICYQEDRLRADLYGLMGALLLQPPLEATLRLLDGVQAGAAADGALAQCWLDLRTQAGIHTTGELDEEYHHLFIGLGRGEVIPYGSWYLAGRLMDKPLARLRADLAHLGIERRPESRETEDHAAALCETMVLLVNAQPPVSRALQGQFFRAHLASWMPRFFSDLQAAPSACFYRAVGRTAQAFLALEAACFDISEDMATPPRAGN